MGYIRRPIVSAAACDVCGTYLELVGDDLQAARDSLNITITGGTGQFYTGPPLVFVLCHKCASRLLVQYPTLDTAIKEVQVQ